MQRAQESGNTQRLQRAGQTARLAFACLFCSLAVLFTGSGCSLMPHKEAKATDDPLCGPYQPPSHGNSPRAAPGKTTSKSNAGAVPALPVATSTLTTAGIANNDPLQGGHPLSIGGATTGQSAPPWQAGGAHLTSGQRGDGINPKLRPPAIEELPAANSVGGGAPAKQVGWSNTTAEQGYDQLLAQLKAHNVTWHRLEKTPTGFKFTCTAPSPANASMTRTYEFEAADYATAMRAVLKRIDDDRGQR